MKGALHHTYSYRIVHLLKSEKKMLSPITLAGSATNGTANGTAKRKAGKVVFGGGNRLLEKKAAEQQQDPNNPAKIPPKPKEEEPKPDAASAFKAFTGKGRSLRDWIVSLRNSHVCTICLTMMVCYSSCLMFVYIMVALSQQCWVKFDLSNLSSVEYSSDNYSSVWSAERSIFTQRLNLLSCAYE